MFRGWRPPLQETRVFMEAVMPKEDVDDLRPRPMLSALAQLGGWDVNCRRTGIARLDLPAEWWLRSNWVTPGTEAHRVEYAALQKGQAAAASKAEPGVIRFDGMGVKRTLPTTKPNQPKGGIPQLKTFDEYLLAMGEYATWAKKMLGVGEWEKLWEFVEAMKALWYESDVFKKQVPIFLKCEKEIRETLMHRGEECWAVKADDARYEMRFAVCRVEATKTLEAQWGGRAPPVQPEGGAPTRAPAPKPKPGAPGTGGGSGKGKGLPKTVGEAMEQGLANKRTAGGGWYCLRYAFGTCVDKKEGNGCIHSNGKKYEHLCFLCGGRHTLAACPEAKRQ